MTKCILIIVANAKIFLINVSDCICFDPFMTSGNNR